MIMAFIRGATYPAEHIIVRITKVQELSFGFFFECSAFMVLYTVENALISNVIV